MTLLRGLAASVAALAASAAPAAAVPLPPATLTLSGSPYALAASGPRAVLSAGCAVRVVRLLPPAAPVTVPRFGDCTPLGDSTVSDLHLGRTALVAEQYTSPSPHGESFSLWSGPLPRGPLRQTGDEWGWTDSDVPSAFGCTLGVTAGAGVLAVTPGPNDLGVDGVPVPACVGTAQTVIRLLGAARASVTVAGQWTTLATDGRRLALARLGADGKRTGEVALVGLDGQPLAAPRFAAAAVRSATSGWLTGQSLILQTPTGLRGPTWAIPAAREGTLAQGRLFYRKGKDVRVRRLRDGRDRLLTRVPLADAELAAGSFGLALAVATNGPKVRLHRLPWRTIDGVLPA